MHKFRKKPVVIEAFRMTEKRRVNNYDWPDWLHAAWNIERGKPGALQPVEEGTAGGLLEIVTLEGVQLVSWGDWIIRGVMGELYPCKPEIFEQTYEKVRPLRSLDEAMADYSTPIDKSRLNLEGD